MKVILTDYVYKYGVAGEVVTVADGYARNWLIPKKLAIPATQKNLNEMAHLREQAAQNRVELNGRVNEAARQINGAELIFGVKAGSNNKLYGSITSQMIKDALLKKTGIDINRRRISDRSIRELGRYEIPVRMGEANPVIQVIVLREEEVAAYNAGKMGAIPVVPDLETVEAAAPQEAPAAIAEESSNVETAST